MSADTLCPRCEGFGNTGVWRGIVSKCRNCDATGRVPVVSGWRPHEPQRRNVLDEMLESLAVMPDVVEPAPLSQAAIHALSEGCDDVEDGRVFRVESDQFDEIERDYLLVCYQERLDTIQYELNHAIESDATASFESELTYEPGQAGYTICVDPVVASRPQGSAVGDQFYVTPREARVLAARLLRAATAAEMETVFPNTVWKFKSLEGVERVDLAIDLKGRKVEP